MMGLGKSPLGASARSIFDSEPSFPSGNLTQLDGAGEEPASGALVSNIAISGRRRAPPCLRVWVVAPRGHHPHIVYCGALRPKSYGHWQDKWPTRQPCAVLIATVWYAPLGRRHREWCTVAQWCSLLAAAPRYRPAMVSRPRKVDRPWADLILGYSFYIAELTRGIRIISIIYCLYS